jgi:transcriptional regulator with XRE-family HTH domain
MGVEGKDRAKVLEAGAAALSNQLGRTVAKLRRDYGLSLADLSAQSGVAKSIISQIERNETNPTLSTIWRLAHALDVSIESVLHGAEEGPFLEHASRGGTPILISDDGLCRLAVIGWLKTVDWLQWYDFQAEPGGVLGSEAHPRGSIECLSLLEGELEVEVGNVAEPVRAGETLRYRCDRPHRIRNLSRAPAHATMVCILKAAARE